MDHTLGGKMILKVFQQGNYQVGFGWMGDTIYWDLTDSGRKTNQYNLLVKGGILYMSSYIV